MVKRWWLKVALALLLCAMWSALGTGVRAQGTVPPNGVSLEDKRLIDKIECVMVEGEQYCLGLGFIVPLKGTPEFYAMFKGLATFQDGDSIHIRQILAERAALSVNEKRNRDAQELALARQGVGFLKMVNAMTYGSEFPEGFFDTHPLFGIVEHTERAQMWHRPLLPNEELKPQATNPEIPPSEMILDGFYRAQETAWWCGPATMESIGDGGGVDKTQAEWADILNTTETGGTWIGSIVNAINSYTHWDSSEHGGPYIIYYLNGRTQAWFENAHRLRIGLGMAPIVENVNLNKKFFSYAPGNEDSYNPHFQLGRGYNDYDSKYWRYPNHIFYFEPWAGIGPYQVPYGTMYRAIMAHRYPKIGG